MNLTKLGFDSALYESKNHWNLSNVDENWIPFLNHGFFHEKLDSELSEKESIFKYMYQMYDHLISIMNIDCKNKVVLDIGCGYGTGINFLKRKYEIGEAYGIDLIPQNISIAENTYKDVKYFTFDARNLNFLDLKVDVVTSVESLCYYPDCDSFFIGLNKILKDDGVAVLTTVINQKVLPIVIDKFIKHNFKLVGIMNVTENVWKGSFLQYKLLEDVENISKKCRISKQKLQIEKKLLFDTIKSYRKQEALYFTFCVKKDV